MNVLIVEDDPVTAMLVTSNVLQWSYQTSTVASAEEAIEFLNEHNDYYIVVTDWSLGGMPGTELASYIKENFSSLIYVIMLTNRKNEEHLVHAMEQGVDDYIAKPFSPAELRVRLRAGERLVEKSLKLAFLANHDELTQLWNRRMLTEQMTVEWTRKMREGTDCCLAMLDLDKFKDINDKFGHATGDLVLQRFSKILKKFVRPYDLVGRFGGEEFVIMFPNATIEQGKKVCERLRLAFSQEQFTIDETLNIQATVSIGLSAANSKDLSYSEVLKRADNALYKSKRNGRNQVTTESTDETGTQPETGQQ